MKKIIVLLTLTAFFVSLGVSAMASEIKVSADLELYYENATDTGNGGTLTEDDDRWQTNQLYLTIDGKFDGYDARLKFDGADMENDGATRNYIEEANFTLKDIAGSPVTVVFGKDEMPFGLDYDKYLSDPLVHAYEIDKVFGIHTIIAIQDIGSFAFALYESRRDVTDVTVGGFPITGVAPDANELGDHFTARVKIDKLVENLMFELSFASEQLNDGDTVFVDEDEEKYSIGAVYKFMEGANVNLEYTGWSSFAGVADYDPGLLSVGAEYLIDDSWMVYGRVEHIFEDVPSGLNDDIEEDFYMLGASYSPVKNYTLSLELTNYSSANWKTVTESLAMEEDPAPGDPELESAIKFGIRAKF